jgi:hypothetical protein
VYAVLEPEQQAFGVLFSAPGPMQVQIPPLHMPEMHSVARAHAEPLGTLTRGCWHVPFRHRVDAQLSLAVQADPFESCAVHVPASHHPEVQSPSPEQAAPFACFPQVPSTQRAETQSFASVQVVPSAPGASHFPALQAAVQLEYFGLGVQSVSVEHDPPSGCEQERVQVLQ